MMKQLKSKEKGFTLIELMVVIVIIGILVAIALPNFIGAQDRAKISSVKSNMHTFQTIVETYAVDWGGTYANNVSTLSTEANTAGKSYWKEFANPFTGSSGAGASYTDMTTFPAASGTVAGLTGYDPEGSPTTKYYVYGLDKVGGRITNKGADFYLTNS